VPPPPGLDYGKGRKGKGKAFSDDGVRADALILSNVPAEVNTLDALNRHFRQFGEVLKITSHLEQGKASIQFANREAAEAAAALAVFNNPDISMAWSLRPARSKGEGKGEKGKASGKAKGLTENRILCCDPEEQRKLTEAKSMKDELVSRKAALLGSLTEQMKTIMGKLQDDSISEEKRDTLRALLMSIKAKMDSFSEPDDEGKGKGKSKGKSKGVTTPSKAKRRNSLDLRSRALKFSLPQGFSLEGVQDELRKLGAGDDQVADLSLGEDDTAVIRFKEREMAEKLWAQRAELPFSTTWFNPGSGEAEASTPGRESASELPGGEEEAAVGLQDEGVADEVPTAAPEAPEAPEEAAEAVQAEAAEAAQTEAADAAEAAQAEAAEAAQAEAATEEANWGADEGDAVEGGAAGEPAEA